MRRQVAVVSHITMIGLRWQVNKTKFYLLARELLNSTRKGTCPASINPVGEKGSSHAKADNLWRGKTMNSRFKIACDLLAVCPSDMFSEYCRIADALEGGASREEILDLPEVERWPDSLIWLKERL
jgi:hypothetical protein